MRESRTVIICLVVVAAWLLSCSHSAGATSGQGGLAFFEAGFDFESNTISPLDLGRELVLRHDGVGISPYEAVAEMILAGRYTIPGADEPDPYAAYRSWEVVEGRVQRVVAGLVHATDVRGVVSRDTLLFARPGGENRPLSLGASMVSRSYDKAFIGATWVQGRLEMDYIAGLISGTSYLRLDAAGVGTNEQVVADYEATYWPPSAVMPGNAVVQPRSYGVTMDVNLRYEPLADLLVSLALRNVLSTVLWVGAQRTRGLINSNTIGTTPDGFIENLPLATGTNSQVVVVDHLDPGATLSLEWRDPARVWAASAALDLGVGGAPSALARVELAVGRNSAVGISTGLRLPGWTTVIMDVSHHFRKGVLSVTVGVGGSRSAGIGSAMRSLTIGLQFTVGAVVFGRPPTCSTGVHNNG